MVAARGVRGVVLGRGWRSGRGGGGKVGRRLERGIDESVQRLKGDAEDAKEMNASIEVWNLC